MQKFLAVAAALMCTTAGTLAVSAPANAAVDKNTMASRCLIWKKTSKNYEGWTAGYSWAWNVVVGPGATGNRVKEIQCLTDDMIGKPAALDGDYGSATKAAVLDVQKNYCGFTNPASWDGVVGQDTWFCLRTHW
jgi:peptidoglycan hydrolase-like protein with peptidoglycan-binding domain